jgi:exodeoxyribonuclease V beta subunit
METNKQARALAVAGAMSRVTIPEFDLVRTPLEAGFNIIEASAGTGKTTTISAIILRLIAEQGIAIENILVATYTELATAELRGRIRETLADARSCVRGGKVKWPFVEPIVAGIADSKKLECLLERALQSFDEAPIFTIHGFCARVLADRAFESGVLFETELVTDQSRFLSELADDFWRMHLYGGDKVVAALLRNRLSPPTLMELLKELTNNPTLRVLPSPENQAALEKEIGEIWRGLCDCWSKSQREIRSLLLNIAWAKGNHFKRDVVDAQLSAAAECIGKARSAGDVFSCVQFFSSATLQANTRVRGITPRHEFFERCKALTELTQRFVVSFESEFCQWAREELRRRKADRRVQSFDDLLTQLNAALVGERGEQLRHTLRERFQVALIDEFQDTDPVQYSILSQIYLNTGAPVFLIGDPKQAIYGFRGADVFTYLEAAKAANRTYSLGKNWRSEAKLVEGVSEIFQQRDDAFVISGIRLAPVSASGTADTKPMTIDGSRGLPLRLWISSPEQKEQVPLAVAGEIARLLASDTRIAEKKLQPSEIAVLVMTNAEPTAMQEALAQLRIPSVVYSAVSVFESNEAEELLRLLLAVARPAHEKFVRAALATDLLGLTTSKLQELFADDARWEEALNRFARYQERWRDEGFVEMMRKLVLDEEVRPRLLAYVDGDRRLTNLLHLIETLHAVCTQNRFGIDGLIAWLDHQISPLREIRDEYELRLESDEDAVRIVTIHKSKGLEYDVIFCPSIRKEPWKKKDLVKFHDRDLLVLDLEQREEHQQIQDREQLAELVRQLYVGMTRARHRSYLVWQERKSRSKSAMAWLWSGMPIENFIKKGDDSTVASVRASFCDSDRMRVEDLPRPDKKTFAPLPRIDARLVPRIFDGEIDRSWRISSFSSLITGRTEELETPDYDRLEDTVELVEEPGVPTQGIHAFPGGMRAGTCLHLILEELDFADVSQLRPLVRTKLTDFHFEGFDDVVCDTLEKTLRVPLGEDSFSLSQISRRSRLSELEFTFPLTALTTARLRKAFQIDDFPLAIDRLQFAPANGLMKGFIDLVFEYKGRFYFVDWKSNRLGMDSASYTLENIAAEMARNFYHLQLGVYAVALHRYLQRRLAGYDYEKNFGGCFYIFLRGVDPERPENGIFADRPARKFVERLDKIFHGNS